jgi:hypothetical protein
LLLMLRRGHSTSETEVAPVVAGTGEVEVGADERRRLQRREDAALPQRLVGDRSVDGRLQPFGVGAAFGEAMGALAL